MSSVEAGLKVEYECSSRNIRASQTCSASAKEKRAYQTTEAAGYKQCAYQKDNAKN